MKLNRNPRRVKTLIATMAAFFWVASASATTYYLNVSEASKSYSGWATLDNWSTTAGTTGDDNHPTSFSSEDEFVVPPYSGGFTLRTMSTEATWPGKSLRIGGEPHLNNSSLAVLRQNVQDTKASYGLNNTNYLEVITAQSSLLNAEISKVTDDFNKVQAVVNLYVALGGGAK